MSAEPSPHRPGPGLRPTLRQLMIVVLYAALVLSVVAALVPEDAPRAAAWSFGVAIILGLSLPVLGLLIRLLDRPGPMREWLSRLLFAALLPGFAALAIARNVDALLGFGPKPGRVNWFVMFFAGLFLLNFLCYELPSFVPRRCPACGRRALLPRAMELRHDRTARRHCLSCGREFGGVTLSDPKAEERGSIAEPRAQSSPEVVS